MPILARSVRESRPRIEGKESKWNAVRIVADSVEHHQVPVECLRLVHFHSGSTENRIVSPTAELIPLYDPSRNS